jgi:type II secretory ATPase GspE/PulE/Tfp pilus assembly ATPase PilB-like protein
MRRKNLPEPVLKRLLKAVDMKNRMESIYIRGEGCEYCNNKGFHKQTVVAEVIATDHALLTHLRNNDFSSAHKHWTEEQNGKSFVQHAIQLIEDGQLDPLETEKKLGLPLNYDKVFSNYRLTASDLEQISGQGN